MIAYCFRFIYNARNPKGKKFGSLTVDEIDEALLRCIRKTRELSYPDELRDLQAGRPVRKNSKLLSLHPFVDKDGLIRVGERLQAAVIDYDQKHQVILPPIRTDCSAREYKASVWRASTYAFLSLPVFLDHQRKDAV